MKIENTLVFVLLALFLVVPLSMSSSHDSGEVSGVGDSDEKGSGDLNGSIEGIEGISYNEDCTSKNTKSSNEGKEITLKFKEGCENKALKIGENTIKNLDEEKSGLVKLNEDGEVTEANLTAGDGGSVFNLGGAEINASQGETIYYQKNEINIKGNKDTRISVQDKEKFTGTVIKKSGNSVVDVGKNMTVFKGSVRYTKNGYVVNPPENGDYGANFEYKSIRMVGSKNGYPIKIRQGQDVDKDFKGHYIHDGPRGYFIESHNAGGQLTMDFKKGNELFETPEGTFTSITTQGGHRLEILKAGTYDYGKESSEYSLGNKGTRYLDKDELDITRPLPQDHNGMDYPLVRHSSAPEDSEEFSNTIFENGQFIMGMGSESPGDNVFKSINSQVGFGENSFNASDMIIRSAFDSETEEGEESQIVFNTDLGGVAFGGSVLEDPEELKNNPLSFKEDQSSTSDPLHKFTNPNSKKAYSFLKGQIGKPWAYGSLGDEYFDEEAGEWREVPANQTAWDCISLCKVTAAKATPGVSEEEARSWNSDMRLKDTLERYGWETKTIDSPGSGSKEEKEEMKNEISKTDPLSAVLELKKVPEHKIKEDGTVIVEGRVLEEGMDYVIQDGEVWRLNHALVRGANNKEPTMIESNRLGQRYMPQKAMEYNERVTRQGEKAFFDGVIRSKGYVPEKNRKLMIIEPPQGSG